MSRPLLEFGGGSGEILRDLLHLRSVSEAEALISGAEGRDISLGAYAVPLSDLRHRPQVRPFFRVRASRSC